MNCIFQLVAFPRIVRRIGLRRVFIASVIPFFPSVYYVPLREPGDTPVQ